MAGMRRSSVSLESKTVRSVRLTELLVAQLCAYSMLSALCFAYRFTCSIAADRQRYMAPSRR